MDDYYQEILSLQDAEGRQRQDEEILRVLEETMLPGRVPEHPESAMEPQENAKIHESGFAPEISGEETEAELRKKEYLRGMAASLEVVTMLSEEREKENLDIRQEQAGEIQQAVRETAEQATRSMSPEALSKYYERDARRY